MATFSQGVGKVCYLLPWLSPPQHDCPLSCEEGEDQLAPSAVCPSPQAWHEICSVLSPLCLQAESWPERTGKGQQHVV